MSLVAYGGSDEENSSEDEVENPKSTLETRDHKQRAALKTSHSTRVPVASSSKGDGYISDEEDYEAVSSSSNLVFSDSLEKDGAQDINSTSAHFLSSKLTYKLLCTSCHLFNLETQTQVWDSVDRVPRYLPM